MSRTRGNETLDTLVHNIAEDSFDEVTYGGVCGERIDRITTWTDAGMTLRIRECLLTYDAGGRIDAVTTTQYGSTGSVVYTMTETFGYAAPAPNRQIVNITRDKTPDI